MRVFEELSVFFYKYSEYIPITFLLGFYVSCVFNRWAEVFNNLGWIDSPSLLIATYVRGGDEMARRTRRNLVRYLVLCQAMVFRDVSTCVKKRFPTMDHLVTAGFMTENELREFDAIKSPHIKYWLPIQWAFLLVRKARDVKMIESDMIYVDLLEPNMFQKFRQYRIQVLQLTLYDWVPIPLVYTQVVHIAVRAYFLVALMGRQYLLKNGEQTIDLFVPVMTIFQFLFYIGWMKVAEVLLNPLGEDDDDFETNWVLDRNLQVGLSIVDDCYGKVPALERDIFWEDMVPQPLYTAEAAQRPHNPMIGSCNDLASVTEDALLVRPRRRLMSTVAMTEQRDSKSTDIEAELAGEPVIPVRQHNPMRRSLRSNELTRDRAQTVLGSIRRRFTKKISPKGKRRDSGPAPPNFGDWYEKGPMPRFAVSKPEGGKHFLSQGFHNTHNGNIPSRQSSCSSILYDGIQSPFSQSISAFSQARGSLDTTEAMNNNADNLRKEEDDRFGQSGAWTVNEMLPVIHEEKEKSKNSSSVDSMSDSYQSTVRSENDSRPSLPILQPIHEESRSHSSRASTPNMAMFGLGQALERLPEMEQIPIGNQPNSAQSDDTNKENDKTLPEKPKDHKSSK